MTYVVALSGGMDSVLALLKTKEKALANKQSVIALHINHNIQPEHSIEWEKYCQKICMFLNIPIFSKKLNFNKDKVKNIENWARDERYNYFKTFIHKGDILITGHHSDDDIETILFKLFRGSVDGIFGIHEKSNFHLGTIERPLIHKNKKDIEQELISKVENEYPGFPRYENGQFWVTDFSNYETKYDRNYIRNVIIPNIEERFPKMKKNVTHSIKSNHQKMSTLENFFFKHMEETFESKKNNKYNLSQINMSHEKFQSLNEDEVLTFLKIVLNKENTLVRGKNLTLLHKQVINKKSGIQEYANFKASIEVINDETFLFIMDKKENNFYNSHSSKEFLSKKIDGHNGKLFKKPIKLSEFFRVNRVPLIIRNHLKVSKINNNYFIEL